MKVWGEGVKHLVGAHVRVGVDDTLTAALYSGGCERHGGAMASARAECALSPVRCWLDLGRDSRGSPTVD